ncbi:MAG: hypothetical protein KDI44_05395 [Thiothrix sp.]|nr:hypothetical protein [Thiothrix sp.]HPQ94473.1 hypothetical protein [Thiolinea sp.]
MKKHVSQQALLVLGVLLMPLSAMAIRMNCTDDLVSELPVKVSVTIPAFLYFQVGSADAVPVVSFDASSSLPAPGTYAGTGFPPAVSGLAPQSITGSDVADGVNVRVRSNCGQVKISYAVSDPAGLADGQGHHVAFDTLQTSSSDAGLPAPVLSNTATGSALVTNTAFGTVTDRSAVWQYHYQNAAMPVAGVYEGVVSYQAACL